MFEDVEQVYREYYPKLVQYVSSLCGDPDTAQDIAQDTFLQVLKHIDSFDGRSSFQTWLFSIGRRELLHFYRKNNRQVLMSVIEEEQLSDQAGEQNAASVEAQALNRVFAEEIARMVADFDEPLHTIVRLRLFEGRSFKEIAASVQRSETYCRVAFFRARQILRKGYQS